MKTIGVLGGIGPQATMAFEARIHHLAQQAIPQWANTGYPPMVVHYFRQLPFLLGEDGRPRLPLQVEPLLIETAAQLGRAADFLVLTSNAPHLFKDQIEAAAGREVLSMIDTTMGEVQRRGWKHVGVLGMGNPVVYTTPLGHLGLACETIELSLRARLDAALIGVMEGRVDPAGRAVADQAIDALRARGVDGIILGCTEIPFLVPSAPDASDLIDPAHLLVEAALHYAMR
jgi:aspartate racemase